MRDLIERQAEIDALGSRPGVSHISDYYGCGARNQYDKDRLALETLPPAEPKVEDVVDLDFKVKELKKAIDHVVELLTSAQPEPIKINIEDFNKEDWEQLKKEWGNTPITVLPAQPEIVRCKECVYHAGWNYCEEVDGLWYDDDFCCHGEKGERREE